jgi:hypothetical protein
MGAFVSSRKAIFSAALTGSVFAMAVTAMTGCASAQSRWQAEAHQDTVGTQARQQRRLMRQHERAAELRQERREERWRAGAVRRARVIRTAPIVDADKCRPQLAVVGDQYASESGAQGEADKAWMQTARWQWGERYMAREHAVDAAYECGRSSVGSVVGQVFYRCRLTAKPCRPEASPGK